MTKKHSSATEKKIKQAAREIFLLKGYNGSRTREITEKAGVNLALLNYYFGGKKELFESVMFELLEDFRDSMFKILNDKNTSFEEKIEKFCDNYYSASITSSKVLPFILESMREHMITVQENIVKDNAIFSKTVFAMQYIDKTGKSINEFKEFFINLLGIIVFPIVGSPMITTFFEFQEEQYNEFLKKRKELVLKLVPELI